MPHVDKEALESLLWEANPGSSWYDDLDLDSDDAASKVADSTCRKLSLLRYDVNLNLWFLIGVWIAGATAVGLYGNRGAPGRAVVRLAAPLDRGRGRGRDRTRCDLRRDLLHPRFLVEAVRRRQA